MREAGKETAEYEAFPGMKFELGAQVVSTGSSFEECEYTCSREQEGCAAFSYSASKKVCMKTAEQLHYSTKFNYYEKTGLSPGERKQMSERREVRQKAKQRRKWEQNFVRQSAQDDRNLNKAVEATEADERMKKSVEAEMELAKGDMKERKQKLLITAKRKERYEAMAKKKGTTAEMIEAEERETEAMKEVTEKQQMTLRNKLMNKKHPMPQLQRPQRKRSQHWSRQLPRQKSRKWRQNRQHGQKKHRQRKRQLRRKSRKLLLRANRLQLSNEAKNVSVRRTHP